MTLRPIVLTAIPLFILHAVEEYFTNFYHVDESYLWVRNTILLGISNDTLAFVAYQTVFILLLLIAYVFVQRQKVVAVLIGLVFVLELSHLFLGLMEGRYYPGLVSSLPLIGVGFVYWHTLLYRSTSS